MAIQKILQTDTLDSGFRVKYNETADSIINGNGILDANGNIKLPKEDGTFWTIDIKSYYASKADVTEMLVPAIRLATDTVTGQVRKATLSELVNGSSDFAYISSMQLLYALENISLLVDTLKIGDNLFENGLVKLLSTDGTNANTDIGISVVDNLGVESNYFKLINDTWTTDTGFKGDYLDFNTSSTALGAIGRLKWNDQDGTLDLGLKGGNVTLQIGQEQVLRVVNKTGATLNEADFRAVRIRDVSEGGSQGNRLAVKLAQADSDADSATTIGIVTETIGDNQEGFITTSGNVSNIDTTGAKSYNGLENGTWTAGDILYLDPLHAGYLTNVKPQAPNHTIIVGWVVNAHQNQGKIFVKVDNGYEIDELHNVKITTVADKDVLIYNNTLGVWENKSILNAGLLDGSGTANYLPKWTDSNTLTNSILYESGGLIGIGTTSLFSIGKLALSGASGTAVFSIERSNPVTNGGLGAIAFKNTDATTPFLSAITSTFGSTTTTSYLSFRLGTASANPYTLTEIARISANGNFIIGGTFADIGTKFQVVGDSYFNGRVGIGTSTLTGTNAYNLRIGLPITGGTSNINYAILQNGVVQSDTTVQAFGITNQLFTQATSFTLTSYWHFNAFQSTLGAGSAITNQYGYYAGQSLVSATNNYGFWSGIPTGSNNNWNLYMAGTAPNYMAGSLGIGSQPLSYTNLRINKNITGDIRSYGVYQTGQVQTDVTTAGYGFRNDSNSVASIPTFANYVHYASVQGTMNTAPTNHYGFQVSSLTSGTNIFGFYGDIASGATRWNLYMNGTAKNYLSGSLLIGTTTDNGYKLDVTGTGRFTGVVQFDAIPTHSLTPSLANHIVNKAYVDSLALVKRGDNVKTISFTNNNLNGTQTINGVALVAGDLVLVASPTNQTLNGVYVVTSGAWTRSANNDSDAEIRGAYHFITDGTYANQRYINTNTSAINIVAGVSTTNITYAIDFGQETDPVFKQWRDDSRTARTVYIGGSVNGTPTWRTLTIADISDLSLSSYYTKSETDSLLSAKEATIAQGANTQYWRGDKTWQTLSTAVYALFSGTAPINFNSSTGEISMLSATSLRDGYLTKEDWATFNNKLGITSTFTLSGDVSGSGVYNSISTTVNAIKNKTIPTLATGLLRYDGTNFVFDNNYIKLTNLSSTAIGLTYTNTTGVFSLTSGYSIPTTANQTNWTTGYNQSITAITINGTTTKTLTITRQNAPDLSATFTDENSVLSVNGLSGVVVLDTDDISEGVINKYFAEYRVHDTILGSKFSVLNTTAVVSTDKLLNAIGKLQGQINVINSASKTITLTGDITGSGNLGTSINTTLANSGVTAGTYRSVTVDVKGRVTAGTNPTTISGYGITDFYSQTLPSFTATNSAIISGDTLLNALQKAQGQINNSFKKADISSNNNYLVKFASATNTLTQSLIFDNGTNIGIGTTSPTRKLDVNGNLGFLGGYFNQSSNESQLFLINSATINYSGSYLYLQSTQVQTGDTYDTTRISSDRGLDGTTQYQIARNLGSTYNGLIYRYSDLVGHNFYIPSSRTSTTTSSLLSINSNGNIGIGITSPTSKLHVAGTSLLTGNVTTNGSILLQSSAYLDLSINQTDSARLSFGITSATNETFINVINNEAGHITGVSELKLLFNSVEKFRFNSDGNLGIGTTNPSYKLHVVGDANLAGKLFINGSTGLDHQFLKFDGTNHVWAYLNVGELEDADTIVKYELDNGERGIKFYTADKTNNVFNNNDTLGFIFTNEDTGIFGIHGYSLNSSGNLQEYGIQIDQDTNIYRLKADGKRARILTTDDSITGGGTTYSFSSPLILSNNSVSIQKASSTSDGYLSADDWNRFNSISGGSANITASSPLIYGNGNLSIQQATSTQNGFLSANDWNSFNSKISGNGGLIDGGNLSIRTSLLIGTSNADYAILSPSLYKLTIAQNSSSISEIIIQSKNGTGGTVKIDTNNFYIGNVKIDMSTYGAGKKLTYLSATEATWQ